MDRFFSKFPGGSVGLALLFLRLADGLGLVAEGWHLFAPLTSGSEPAGVVLLGLVLLASATMLVLGLRSTLAGGAAAVGTGGSTLYGIQHGSLLGSATDAWFLLHALVFVVSSSLALAGPGAYSLDARLSGWRQITLPLRRAQRPNEWDILS